MTLSISIARPAELNSTQIDLWRQFQLSDSRLAHPCLSPEFSVLFGRHRKGARVAVLEEGNEVVGFFPYEQQTKRIANALAYGLSDAQGVVHKPGFDWQHDQLLRACGLDVFQFDHLVGYQGEQLRSNLVLAPSPVVDVSGGCWNSWLESKRSTTWRRINTGLQKSRKLGREVGELRFVPQTNDPAVLETLMRWKSAQYRRTGRQDRFGKPWFRELIDECLQYDSDEFGARLSALYAGDRLVHVDLSLRANGVLSGWFPAYDVELSHYSPGFVGMLEMIKATTEDPRISQLDMGKGFAPYKESLKSFDNFVAEGFVQRPSLKSAAWWAYTEPRRRVTAFVLANPRLRKAARESLNQVGRLRSKCVISNRLKRL
jgi:CelD/BcsL family acetyltransferase involved in cellulose biosynthesis